ncbi:MAG: oxidoreductase [Ferrimicrobium sp.]
MGIVDSTIALGSTMVRNRVVFCAHLTNYAKRQYPSPQHAAYYAARAKGGAGLVITEEHSVDPSDWPYEKLVHGFDPGVIPAYRLVTDAVHRESTPIFAQLNHNGMQGTSRYQGLAVVGPSALRDPLFKEMALALRASDLKRIREAYRLVARHVYEGGFDGIELQCSHSSLIRQLLSPRTNRRRDAYGGSLENRARFLLEVVDAMREEGGERLTLGARICVDEFLDGGIEREEGVALGVMLEAAGTVDYLNTSIGVATESLFMIEGSMALAPAYSADYAAELRRSVSLPVIAVGRFKDLGQVERALVEGVGDLIGMVRAQIADPELVRKSRTGRVNEVTTCLSCNQECVGRMGANRWLGCIERPGTGREADKSVRVSLLHQEILVIGGGPAGMAAAIALADAGASVRLVEASKRLGGIVPVYTGTHRRAEFRDLVRNLELRLRRSGAVVDLEKTVESAQCRNRVVVVATGSNPRSPLVSVLNGAAVGVEDVLVGYESPPAPGQRVVIVDELGFHEASALALDLAERGCVVAMVTPHFVTGGELGSSLDYETFLVEADRLGVSRYSAFIVDSVGWGWITIRSHLDGTTVSIETDRVFVAGHRRSDTSISTAGAAVAWRIGDALAPRRAHAGIIEGFALPQVVDRWRRQA